MFTQLQRYAAELRRLLRNHQYERDGAELVLDRWRIGGHFVHQLNDGPLVVDPNLIPNEGLDYFLDVALSGGSQLPAFYLALFSGNVTPAAGWTGANFAANSTEVTTLYDEVVRPTWVEAGVSAQAISNLASLATFTINDTVTVYGAGLLSSSTKGGVTGKLIAATRFATARGPLADDDLLKVGYTLSASST